MSITSSEINNNTANGNGGGVYTSRGLTVTSIVVNGNKANAYGGIYSGSDASISYCLLMNNSADNVAAIYCSGSNNLKLTCNTLINNTSNPSTVILVKGYKNYTISHNNFCDNATKYDLDDGNPSSAPIIDVSQNYWCTDDEYAVTERIFDWYDDSLRARWNIIPSSQP